jgi:hypothetical protein
MLCFSRASVHLVPSTSLSRCRSCWHNCSDALHRRCVGSSGAEGLFAKTLLSASTRASDEPLSYRQFIRCWSFVWVRLCLDSNEVPDRPTVSSLRPSDHPVLLILLNSSGASRNWTVGSSDSDIFILLVAQCTKYTDACTDGTVGSSDGVNFLHFLPHFIIFSFRMWYFCIHET